MSTEENPERLKGIAALANSPSMRKRHRAVLLDFVSSCNANDSIRSYPDHVRNAYAVASGALSANDPAQEWDAVGLLGAVYSVHWSELAGTAIEPLMKRAVHVSVDAFEVAQGNRPPPPERQPTGWRPWQQWSVGLGGLGLIAAFLNPEVTNPSYEVADRIPYSLGAVMGPMIFGAVISALFGLVAGLVSPSQVKPPQSFAAASDGSTSAWRKLVGSWWLWIVVLIVAGALAPLPFQHSAEGKTDEVLRMIRFSPMTGLALKEVPGLEAEVEGIFSAMFTGSLSEGQAMNKLHPLLRDARANHLNPGFRNASDFDATQTIARGLAAMKHLQKVDAAACRQFSDSGSVNPDRLDQQGKTLITSYGDALRNAYINGRDTKAATPIATADDVAQLLQRLGVTQDAAQRAANSDAASCAFSVRITELFAGLPAGEQARLQRYLLSQTPP